MPLRSAPLQCGERIDQRLELCRRRTIDFIEGDNGPPRLVPRVQPDRQRDRYYRHPQQDHQRDKRDVPGCLIHLADKLTGKGISEPERRGTGDIMHRHPVSDRATRTTRPRARATRHRMLTVGSWGKSLPVIHAMSADTDIAATRPCANPEPRHTSGETNARARETDPEWPRRKRCPQVKRHTPIPRVNGGPPDIPATRCGW